MAQDFAIPSINDSSSVAIGTKTANSLTALRSSFSGTSAPGAGIRVGGMLWADSTDGELKIRSLADAAWVPVMKRIEKVDERQWAAAAFTCYLLSPMDSARLEMVRVISTTATTGSSAGVTDYVIDVHNVTEGHSLLSSAISTGDGEIAANTPFDVTPDQNDLIAGEDVVEFRVTVNGTPTTLTRVAVYAYWIPSIA